MKFTKKKNSNKQNKTNKKPHTQFFFYFLQKLITVNIQLKGEL